MGYAGGRGCFFYAKDWTGDSNPLKAVLNRTKKQFIEKGTVVRMSQSSRFQ